MLSQQPHISLFIPAYNVVEYLESTISRIPGPFWEHITSAWIINDGSTDDTLSMANALADQNHKIRVINFGKNCGYGSVIKKGLALCKNDMSDYAICLHGDGQYPPETIPSFIEHMQLQAIDILQGSRIASGTALKGGMPLYKFIANRMLTLCENIVFGLHLTDFHSGYLLYSKTALNIIPFDQLSNSFDIDVEIIASSKRHNLSIGELPIPTRYAGEVSHVNSIAYGFRVLAIMGRYLKGSYRPGAIA